MDVMCRAELHGSTTREQYDQFHAQMSGLGLERTITRDGKLYHLPTGEYLGVNVTAFLQTLSVRIAKAALDVTGRTCEVTLTPVADAKQIVFSGLTEIDDYAVQLSYFASVLRGGQASTTTRR
jgi:hypothetical protein